MDATRRSSSKPPQSSPSPSSYHLSGIATRRKSQIFLHLNRSGCYRSDPGPGRYPHCGGFQSSGVACRSDSAKYLSNEDDDDDKLLISDLCKKAKLNQESSVGDCDEPSSILIKDLRARRVYSPQSVGGALSNSSPNVDRVGSSCGDRKVADAIFGSDSTMENGGPAGEVLKRDGEIDKSSKRLPSEGMREDEMNSILSSIVKEYQSEKPDGLYVDDALDTMNEETESPVVRFPYKAQSMDHVNLEPLDEEQRLQYVNDGSVASGRIGSLNEVPKLTTPPDIEMCGNLEANEDEEKQVEGLRVKDTKLTGNSEENAKETFCSLTDNRNCSVLKGKSLPRPRLQRKLFKKPGSVSYRRLLPFLKNMTKDDFGTKQFQSPLSSQSQEASEDQVNIDSCPVHDTVESRALTDDSDLSGGNESRLTSYQDFPESPIHLSAEEVAHDSSSVPSVNEHIDNAEISLKRSRNAKVDLAVDFPCYNDVANAVHSDDFKQGSQHSNVHGVTAEANGGGSPSEQICVLNQECLSTPDAGMCGEDRNTPGGTEHHVSSMNLTGSVQANVGEWSLPKAMKRKDDVLKSKSVLKPCLQRKLFKTPGSVSYRRLLPFIMDIAKDDCGAPRLDHQQKDERGVFAKRPQLPLLSHSQEAPVDELLIDSSPMHDTVDKSNINEDKTLVDPTNELSYGNQPKLTSSQVLPEFPIQLDAKEVVQECVTAPSETRGGSEPKNTLVLNPCLHIESLKHSGSFSYRRLLPFLENLRKDNSCATANDHNPKLEKCLDQTTPQSTTALEYQVTPGKDSDGCPVLLQHGTGSSTPQKKTLPDLDDSLNGSSPEVISSAHIPESQSSHDSCKLIQLLDEQVLFSGDSKLESSPDMSISDVRTDSPITLSTPIMNEINTREGDATSAPHQSSVCSEVKENNSPKGEMPLNNDGCCQKHQTNALEQPSVPAAGFRKGILKRNPRGCRGICSCLNCASFRLNAERAFEFSRNQLLDAEEVALDLMKELSHLRNMLERSTDGANNHSGVDENLVKEACSKAFAAEQLAKERLSQMNDELNIHCRITCSEQPRVRFANYTEEKVISPGRFRKKYC